MNSFCMSCLRTGTHSLTCPDLPYINPLVPVIPGRWVDEYATVVIPMVPVDRMGAFSKGPETVAEATAYRAPMPVWPLALVFCGLVLMALGLVLNDPVARALYALAHG